MTDQITFSKSGAAIFEGSAVEIFRLSAIASGLDLYANTRMLPNRAWTPTAMLRNATMATGRKYKRGQYKDAAAAIRAVVEKMREGIPVITE